MIVPAIHRKELSVTLESVDRVLFRSSACDLLAAASKALGRGAHKPSFQGESMRRCGRALWPLDLGLAQPARDRSNKFLLGRVEGCRLCKCKLGIIQIFPYLS